jgi:hypothetical protein
MSPAHVAENVGALAVELTATDLAGLASYTPTRLDARTLARRLGLRRVATAAARLRP